MAKGSPILQELVNSIVEEGGAAARVLAVATAVGCTATTRHVAAAMVAASWREPKTIDEPKDEISQQAAVVEAGLRTQRLLADGAPIQPLAAAIQGLRILNKAVGDAKHQG